MDFEFILQFIGFGLLLIWTIAWKATALWRSARNNHKTWFVIMMIFNTVGILPIIYILLNRKAKENIGGNEK